MKLCSEVHVYIHVHIFNPPSQFGWAPRSPSHCVFHVLVWCIGSGGFNLASVLYTYTTVKTLSGPGA